MTDKTRNITIVDDGIANASIIVGDDASSPALEAAHILQSYIARISDVRLPVLKESDLNEEKKACHIWVGRSKTVLEMGMEIPTGVTPEMNEEGFVIKTKDKDLVIAGNEDWKYRGTIYAVYDFLEELGCRWFFPGEYGEVVPRKKTIEVPFLDKEE